MVETQKADPHFQPLQTIIPESTAKTSSVEQLLPGKK